MREEAMRQILKNGPKRLVVGGIAMVTVLMTVGCAATGSASGSADVPVPPAGSTGAKSYSYLGTQSLDGSSNLNHTNLNFAYGGGWAMSQDDTHHYFSYENTGHEGMGNNDLGVTIPNAIPVNGASSGSGFMILTPAATGSAPASAGYAVELPGEGELLRPGTASATANLQNVLYPSSPMVAPVISAASATCPSLKGTVTYQFIALGSQNQKDMIEHTAYGSVKISGTGTAFTFSNQSMFGFDGKSLSPAAFPVGNCGTTQAGYVISSVAPQGYTFIIPGQTYDTSTHLTANFTLSTALSPSGLFVMDQGQGAPYLFATTVNAGVAVSAPTDLLGLVGVQQPSSPLDTGSIVSSKFAGFEYDALAVSLNQAGSNPVFFGQVPGSGTVMTGGGYANDDVTQTPANNITLSLGQQDSANNGLYKAVTVTVPDTSGNCANEPFGGMDAQKNPICTFHGVAVAGSVGGKFVLFISVNDLSQAIAHLSPYATLQFFLYQQ